jgi:hypothetical protein
MKRSTVLGVALLMLGVPVAARAQSTSGMPAGGHIFLSVNGLGQAGDGELIDQSQSQTIYGETGTVSASQGVPLASGVFDFGGGYRTGRFGVGAAFTASSSTNTAVAVASVPHPFISNQPRTSTTHIDGLEHKERVVHLQAYYFMPVAEKAEIGLFVGPSFYDVTQDYVTVPNGFTESANFETVSIQYGRATTSDSPLGYIIGAEATYKFTPNVGAALLFRFTRASADLDLNGQPVTMNVGDVQFGGGLRFRF